MAFKRHDELLWRDMRRSQRDSDTYKELFCEGDSRINVLGSRFRLAPHKDKVGALATVFGTLWSLPQGVLECWGTA